MNAAWIAMLALAALPCCGQQFWSGTRFGMTRSELVAAVGEVADVPGAPNKAKRLAPAKMCGADLEVTFEFEGEKLSSVVLSKPVNANIPGEGLARCVIAEYAQAYGTPVLDETTRGLYRTVVFNRGDTNVRIAAGLVAEGVAITYTRRSSSL